MPWDDANLKQTAEYRYSDYGKFGYTLFSGVDAIAAETKFHTHTALVGVAYRFGGPVLP